MPQVTHSPQRVGEPAWQVAKVQLLASVEPQRMAQEAPMTQSMSLQLLVSSVGPGRQSKVHSVNAPRQVPSTLLCPRPSKKQVAPPSQVTVMSSPRSTASTSHIDPSQVTVQSAAHS